MIVLLVGVPGAGKTSIINEVKKYLKYEFKVVSAGNIVLELAKEKYNINNRDDIRKKLTFEQQKNYKEKPLKE